MHKIAPLLVCAVIGQLAIGATAVAAEAKQTPVTPVHALRVTARSVSAVSLAWSNPSTATFAGVVVRYAKGSRAPASASSGISLGRFAKPKHAATASGLAPSTIYSFAVFAYDKKGKYSKAVALSEATRTVAVHGLKVITTSPSTVSLSWVNPTVGTFAGVLVRSASGRTAPTTTSGQLVGRGGRSVHTMTATRLSPATVYSFAVFAVDTSHRYSVATTVQARTRPAPGSYSGVEGTNANRTLSFYISSTGAAVQDATTQVTLACAPNGRNIFDNFIIAATPVSGGAFAGSRTQHGVVTVGSATYPATFTYNFSGRFTGTNAAGTFRERLAYNDGVAQSCTTNTLSWTATRDAQGAQTNAAPPSGSYSGVEGANANRTLSFYVSPGGSSIQDVTTQVTLQCTPNGRALFDNFVLANTTISASRGFAGTGTQHGVVPIGSATYPATFTYTLTGSFHSVNNTGVERAAGTFRETLTYNDGTAQSCTTDDVPWYVQREGQGSQTTAAPPSGSYSGVEGANANRTLSFYVSPGGTSIQDVTTQVTLQCTPNGRALFDNFVLANTTINANRSFAGTGSQNGVVTVGSTTYPAVFTYALTGHFHSVNSTGIERAAGTFRETLTYNDGTAQTCTTDNVPWYVQREAQGSQTTAAPPSGSYSGVEGANANRTLSFSVSSGGTSIQNVATQVTLECTPNSRTLFDNFVLANTTINADRSFAGTGSQNGVVTISSTNYPAVFTYAFTGHFHSVNNSGVERAAGTFRETITYNDGGPQTCTTDNVPWYATK